MKIRWAENLQIYPKPIVDNEIPTLEQPVLIPAFKQLNNDICLKSAKEVFKQICMETDVLGVVNRGLNDSMLEDLRDHVKNHIEAQQRKAL